MTSSKEYEVDKLKSFISAQTLLLFTQTTLT